MEPLLQVLVANLRYTAAALKGPLREELLAQIGSQERGDLPDKAFAALSAEAGDLLDEIGLLLQPPVETVAGCFFGFFDAKCLWTAVSLRIPDLLRDGPQPVSALAKLAGADEQRLNQVLRLLAARGVFARDAATDAYRNNTASTLLLRDHWTQWWRWADVYGNDYYGMAQGLADSVAAGAAPRSAAQIHYGNDKSIVEHFRDDGLLGKMLSAIRAGGLAQAPGMVGDCDAWAEMAATGDPLLDVGGGSGGFMASLLRAHPALRGAVLDQESVIATFAPSFRDPAGEFADVSGRCELLVGDFFRAETIPPFKYYCIRWCLHDWPDADAVRILANIRAVIVEAPESRLIVIEAVLAEGKAGAIARYGDVAMMVACSGRQRTYNEWKALAEAAGWVLARATPLRNTWVNAIELRPAPISMTTTPAAAAAAAAATPTGTTV